MDDLELVFFKIISSLGSARSSFMEAMALARTGDFAQAQAAIEQGESQRIAGHDQHFDLLQADAAGDHPPFSLLLVHAEDQLMSAELLKVTAEEVLALYQRLDQLTT